MQSWSINVAARYYGQDIDKVMTWHLLLTQVTIADATAHSNKHTLACIYLKFKLQSNNKNVTGML